jgi:hypothetical protein
MDRGIFLKNGKDGWMEYWNDEQRESFKPNIPTFHYSIIPISKRREI